MAVGIALARLSIGPTAFTAPCPGMKTPAESYPLYSRVLRPSSKSGAAVLFPTYPNIPHITVYNLKSLAEVSCLTDRHTCIIWVLMLERFPRRNETIEVDIADYEDTPLYPLLSKLPKDLVGKHLTYIERRSFSDEEAVSYLSEVISKRQESFSASSISDEGLKGNLEISEEKVFQSLETNVFNDTENYLGTGMTARVKSYSVPTKNGELPLAIKYVVTPTSKTITAEQEHNVLKEVERMRKIEEMETQHERRSRYIKVPHAYLHHRSERLQCYGMEKIEGMTLEQATSDSTPREFLERLKDSPLTQVPEEELMGYIERFFQTMHEQYLHGDMKPANMMVSETGMLYVIDFGQSISVNNVPAGAEEQLSNLQDEEIKLAQFAVRSLLRKIESLDTQDSLAA